jgi:pyruvate dehydrogenase E2 component (dihydrolipoamide acetyltransferase)
VTVIEMPKLSDSMEGGLIVTWLKNDADLVSEGEDLLEIETDKATIVYAAEASGTLEICVPAGKTVDVGTVIAEVHVGNAAPVAPREATAPTASTNGEAAQGEAEIAARAAPGSASPNVESEAVVSVENRRATPLARRIAQAHGADLSAITGTGPLGRITRRDVLGWLGIAAEPQPIPTSVSDPVPAPTTASSATSSGPSGKGSVETIELSRLQALVARRMLEAKTTIPHFQVQTDVGMDRAALLRSEIKESTGLSVSYNGLVVRASALALRDHPLANGSFTEGGFELHSRINVGIAVAAESALVVPTVFDADQKTIAAISVEIEELASRVREGTITPPELASATFTVSNLGMYGMTAIYAVINPPQSAILGLGSIRPTLARRGGEIVEEKLMTLTLSCDHRILYGVDAARFLSQVKALLEQPLSLMV